VGGLGRQGAGRRSRSGTYGHAGDQHGEQQDGSCA
jgi:hypothetical protein